MHLATDGATHLSLIVQPGVHDLHAHTLRISGSAARRRSSWSEAILPCACFIQAVIASLVPAQMNEQSCGDIKGLMYTGSSCRLVLCIFLRWRRDI